LIAVYVFVAQVVQQPAASGDHTLKTASGMNVLAVYAKVVGKTLDVLGKDCYLDFSGTGIPVVDAVFADGVGLGFTV
jgi:hypothetical protein